MADTAENDSTRPDLLGALGRAIDRAREDRRSAEKGTHEVRYERTTYIVTVTHVEGECPIVNVSNGRIESVHTRVLPPGSGDAS